MEGERIRTADVSTSETKGSDFSQLHLSEAVRKGLKESGYYNPTPVQLRAIPLGCVGADLIVQSKAGTGKTLVFAVIGLEQVNTSSALPQVVVLSATREIALQINQVFKQVGRFLEGLQCHAFIGGIGKHADRNALKRCQVVVGSPGRVKDLLCDCALLHPSKVKLFILDEVDALLCSASTLGDVNDIFRALPDQKQVCTFSATYSESLLEQLRTYTRTPQMVTMKEHDGNVSLRGVTEYYSVVSGRGGMEDVIKRKTEVLSEVIENVPFTQCIVFLNDHPAGEALARDLCKRGIAAEMMSAKLEQSGRTGVMERFSSFNLRILVSSDLTSRGVDMTKVNLVVSADVPSHGETYMHRIGRTGRYGSLGLALCIVTPGELEKIETLRKEVGSDSSFLELPKDMSRISSDHMKGVLVTEAEQQKYKGHEVNRADKKAIPWRKRAMLADKDPRDTPKEAPKRKQEEKEDREEEKRTAKRKRNEPAAKTQPVPTPQQAVDHQQLQQQLQQHLQQQQSPQQLPYAGQAQGPTAGASFCGASVGDPGWDAAALWAWLCARCDQYHRAYYSVAFECISQASALGGTAPAALPPPPPVLFTAP
eukprot:Hpha_TRINITY_DN28120_c0_g1::TRINITY_DN28120_c0_g1_i1::g.103252::m.103252/K13131/DDX20, GEMIN3; ATP-dependent RNA helicase DDX20